MAKYNYGSLAFTLMHYREVAPLAYNLSNNLPGPVDFHQVYGERDVLFNTRDVQTYLDTSSFNGVGRHSMQCIKSYFHANFIMGLNAEDVVYGQVLSFT
ncbi:hypothetical protein CDL15_Pgr018547 [Punica granatum]|uniref:Uncharacterized protein n=1 Tax=Punica granatum TaxID=22663 RepID=A0A218WZI7_PUNGR|nr:hypothetical protein CDL15_Pgr018547 [Punica granatum]PKI64872.1 hypothetical protein CRG98_014739 [Punica granatum]